MDGTSLGSEPGGLFVGGFIYAVTSLDISFWQMVDVIYSSHCHFQQQSMPFVTYMQKKNVNGTESSCECSGSVLDEC